MGPSPILAVVTQPQNPFLKLNSPNSVTFKTSKIYCIETARQLLHNLYILGTSINKKMNIYNTGVNRGYHITTGCYFRSNRITTCE
jgi:transposase